MKKIFAVALTLLTLVQFVQGQELLRYNYKRNGYVYTGTERLKVDSSLPDVPLYVKLSRVAFPDGESIFILRLDFEDASRWIIPKNSPAVFTLTEGGSLSSKHMSDEASLVAPNGFITDAGRRWWNYGEYYLEEDDVKRLIGGVEELDVTRRWSENGHLRYKFKGRAFSTAIARQYGVIRNSKMPKRELDKMLRSVQDQSGNRMVRTKAVSVGPKLSVALSYLYYTESNNENYDLHLYLPGVNAKLGGVVNIYDSKNEMISLSQERDDESGQVVCYPSIDELKKLASGIRRIEIETGGAPINIETDDEAFSLVLNSLYSCIQTVSVL